MLTEIELQKIYSWLPYREDWPIDRNSKDDNIEIVYGSLINSIRENDSFDSYYSEDGGLGNYLEFFAYPKVNGFYSGNAVQICISLCCPVIAYGQITVHKTENSFGWGHMFSAESIGIITDSTLTSIQSEIKTIIARYNLVLLTSDLASLKLPKEVAEELQSENHNDGNQILQGIFQKTD